MTTTTWRCTTARRTEARQHGVPTGHPRVHVHVPMAGLGLGIVTPRR